MTNKIVIINGSPRKGNTVAMLESFKEAISVENAPSLRYAKKTALRHLRG